MKIGILNAINPQESKVNWPGPPEETYIRFLECGGGRFETAAYAVALHQLPDSPAACDAYLITGSPRGAYDTDPWIGELAQFIRDSIAEGQKFVGICFGHQILAQALGGEVRKSAKGWGLGLQTYHISGQREWMDGFKQELNLYFAHQDQVERLPAGAELLGGNDFCPNGMYAIDNQVLGIQGHPEFSRGIMTSIIDRSRAAGDDRQAAEAGKTLDRAQPDNDLVARWVVGFLEQ